MADLTLDDLLAGTYSSVEFVQDRVPVPIRPSSTPSTETVQYWIRNGADQINSRLTGFGSPFTDLDIIKILEPINTDYAASRVFGALTQLPEAERLDRRFEDYLDKIVDGKISLGIERDATFVGGYCPE